MRVASFGLLALGLMLCVGFALAGALPALAYEKPVAGLVDNGLKIRGESSSVSCGVFECSYKFKVLETAGVSSSLNVLPYFTDSKASIVSFNEVKEKQVVTSWEECESWDLKDTGRVDDKNGEKLFERVCSKWITKQSVETIIERVPVSGGKAVFVKNAKLASNLTQKDYVSATVNANSERTFEIVFKPSSKTGELVIVANDSVNTLKIASLDPWWNASWSYSRQLTLVDNVSERATDKNTLVRVEVPLTTWAHKPLANCNDLRVVYNDSVELDRNLFTGMDMNVPNPNCQTQDVNLFFNLNASLNGTDSTNYKIYYSNAAAGAPSTFVPVNNYALKEYTTSLTDGNLNVHSFNYGTWGVPTSIGYVAGVEGLAANFNATTDKIEFGDSYLTVFNADHTIEFWLYMADATNDRYIMGKGANSNLNEQIWVRTGNLQFLRNDGANAQTCDLNIAGAFLELNKWYHVAFTYSATDGMKGYLNGVQGCKSPKAFVMNGAADALNIWFTLGHAHDPTGTDSALFSIDAFKITNSIKTAFPNGDTNTTARQVSASIGAEVEGESITSNFLTSLDRNYFDSGSGLNTVVGTFYDASVAVGNTDVNGWHWDINGVNYGNDQNFVHSFTAVGDYNITLRIDGNTGLIASHSYVISLLNLVQNLTVSVDNASIASYDSNVQFDLNGSYTGSADTFWFLKNGSVIGSGSTGLHRVETSSGDMNYCFIAQTTNTDVNKQACTSLKVTRIIVKIPLDEQEPATQVKPFDVGIDTNTSATYNDINADVNAWFAGITVLTKNIYVVDDNGDYFGRYYGVSTDGTTQTLQPYLLKKSGAGNVIFYVKTLTPIKSVYGAKVTLKKIISGTKTVMEEQYSDASGVVNFIMVYNDTYYIDANYNDFGFTDYLLRPIGASYTLWIDTGQISITSYSPIWVDANYQPSGFNIKNTGLIIAGLGSTVYSNGAYLSWVSLNITSDGNVLYTKDFNNGGTRFTGYSPTIPNINIGGLTSGHNIIFDWNVRDVNGRYYSLTHTISYLTNTEVDLNLNLYNIRESLGDTGAAFVALFILVVVCGMAIFSGFGNAQGISVLGGIILLFFGLFNFIPWGLAILGCLGAFGVYLLEKRQ